MKRFLLFFLLILGENSISRHLNHLELKLGVLAGVGTAYKEIEYYSTNTGNYGILDFSGGGGLGCEGGVIINP